jgi:hypothetical protein
VRDLLVSPDGAAVYAAGAAYSGSVEMGIFSTFALQRTSAANGALVYAVHLESGIPACPARARWPRAPTAPRSSWAEVP